MNLQAYKAMLALNPQERRALNTFSALRGLTPNRYVEQATRALLKGDAARTGLSVELEDELGPIPGQLAIEDEPTGKAVSSRKRSTKPKKESKR